MISVYPEYSAVDNNPLSLYVMHPFWNTVVKIFPTWLAPNLITFCGFLLLVFNFFLMAYFDPDFYASAPDHVHVPNKLWVIVGLLNFIAYTLDGVDGKQARRTKSSTPLGELFDHGLDSWACMFFVVTVYSTFGRGSNGVSVFVLYLLLWVVLFSFILSHWEKYNTGILFLPWGYDISQVTISIVYIVTSIVGVEAWYEPFLFNILYRDLFTTMIIGCALTVTLPMSLHNYYKAYSNKTLKHDSFYEAMLPFLSPVLLFILCTVWIFQSPSDILEVHPRLFYFMVGTAFANISQQLPTPISLDTSNSNEEACHAMDSIIQDELLGAENLEAATTLLQPSGDTTGTNMPSWLVCATGNTSAILAPQKRPRTQEARLENDPVPYPGKHEYCIPLLKDFGGKSGRESSQLRNGPQP
ncbi:UNVERIFIED_CONTAM: hypothetical protein K2H54_033260 [Gekko kuhli]